MPPGERGAARAAAGADVLRRGGGARAGGRRRVPRARQQRRRQPAHRAGQPGGVQVSSAYTLSVVYKKHRQIETTYSPF